MKNAKIAFGAAGFAAVLISFCPIYAGEKSGAADCSAPQAPTNVKVSLAAKNNAEISWAAVDGAEKYEIYRSMLQSGTYSRIASVSSTSLKNTKVSPKSAYYYKIKALNGCGSSEFSDYDMALPRN